MIDRFDVVIVGGGPAGTATAIALAKAGRPARSVAVLERSGYERARIGETLPPEARIPLAQLGVWERFLEQRHAPSPGTAAAWGREELEENDFIFNPYGNGWHLDRSRFDATLASAAADAGATIHRHARMTACQRAASGDWLVKYVCDDRPCELRARFLVDATGRACMAARRQGAERLSSDRMIGVVGLFAAPSRDQEYRTLVEASADGWWYSAWLPGGRLIVAFMTDADLLPMGQPQLLSNWLRQLQQTVHTRARTSAPTVELTQRPLQWINAASEVLGCSSGTGWLATGDAACSFDPLSSQGIFKALQLGLLAAETIDEMLGTPKARGYDWSLKNRHRFDRYLRTRRAYYGLERRWPDAVFWRRRHTNEAFFATSPIAKY
ncbi:MAG: tryptophan 7-halogenase [Acidobacteriota bacterium]